MDISTLSRKRAVWLWFGMEELRMLHVVYFPTGVAIDANHNVYIADFENNRVRKVDTADIITTFAGKFSGDGGAAINASLDYPSNVTVDESSEQCFYCGLS